MTYINIHHAVDFHAEVIDMSTRDWCYCFVLGQYFTQLWQVKGQLFRNSMIFQFYVSISVKLSIVAAWNPHQRVPRSILHRMMHLGEYYNIII